jgi:hypothetical protein
MNSMASPRRTELPASVERGLEAALAASALRDGPLPVTFATDDFAPLLANWLRHAKAAGVTDSLVIAMDEALAARLEQVGTPAIRHGFDGTPGDLWYQRTLIFEWLARRGVDFIHSDVDAVWLRDPRPFCRADPDFDLVFSQGTNYPPEVWHAWGFVLCCGLFAVKASPATARFFTEVRRMTAQVQDDQVAVNILLCDSGLSWRTGGAESYPLTNRHGQVFTGYRGMLEGVSESAALRVGLLPHDRVPRLPILGAEALVRHPVGPGNPVEKLRAVGCWMVG